MAQCESARLLPLQPEFDLGFGPHVRKLSSPRQYPLVFFLEFSSTIREVQNYFIKPKRAGQPSDRKHVKALAFPLKILNSMCLIQKISDRKLEAAVQKREERKESFLCFLNLLRYFRVLFSDGLRVSDFKC